MSEIISVSQNEIKNRIFSIRNRQVMLDSDLAEFFGVETKRLNEQVKRNKLRFPEEFCFQLNEHEIDTLRSQIVTLKENDFLRRQIGASKNVSNSLLLTDDDIRTQNAIVQIEPSLRSQFATSKSKGGRRYLPYAFTEQGVAMLSAVLRSDTAVKMSVQIINAFVEMRHFIISNARVFERLDALELSQLKTGNDIKQIFEALESRQLQPKQGIFFEGQVFEGFSVEHLKGNLADLSLNYAKADKKVRKFMTKAETTITMLKATGKELSNNNSN